MRGDVEMKALIRCFRKTNCGYSEASIKSQDCYIMCANMNMQIAAYVHAIFFRLLEG